MVGWLLDRCPPEVRATAELRRQPAALALLAVAHTGAVVVGQRDAYRSARRELAAMLPAAALDAVLLDLEGVGHECVRTQREVGLVAEALAGRVWRAKL